MWKFLLPFSLLGTLVLLTFSCANPVAPTGGPRDKTPPQLIPEESTPNFQTNFSKQRIELTYDEWVQLQDVFTQVVVSPPLEFRPKIDLKKRTVRLDFNEREALREDATYVINFGDAIQDLTERNKAKMVFVFSTGDFIDSLSLSGQVVDAFSGKPVEEVLFLLYENKADSVVRTERPFYFGKTDKQGNFKINNVKAGTFKGFALTDQNLNYLFDSEVEKIGFPDSLIQITDSIQPQVKVRLFSELPTLFLTDEESDDYGLVKLIFNREPYDAKVGYDNLNQFIYFEPENDTIRLWYDLKEDREWNVYIDRDTIVDTVRVEAGLKAEFLQNARLNWVKKRPGDAPITLSPTEPITLTFSHPLAGFDTSGIRLFEDSIRTPVQPLVQLDSVKKRQLFLQFARRGGLAYELEILPGMVFDQYGLRNRDTLRQVYNAAPPKEFGNLLLKITGLRPDTTYLIRLLVKGGELVEEFQVNKIESFEHRFQTLSPGNYVAEVIEDLDGNGRWSTGNYDLKRQPERLLTKELEQLRANWDVEAELQAVFSNKKEE